jgi:hypothetical protein
MNKTVLKSLLLTLSFVSSFSITHAAALKAPIHKPEATLTSVSKVDSKPSLIAQAASKQDEKDRSSTHNVMMLNSLYSAPSQNFFAQQNQKFTRFVQSLFS